jgi:DNA-binding transcriptional LysR family regulator
MAMVRAGMGWAVMPMLALDLADSSIDTHPLEPPVPPRQVCAAWRRDRTLSPIARRLIEIAVDVAREHAAIRSAA